MAATGLLSSMLGFDDAQVAPHDRDLHRLRFGTATNVTGDGAIALVLIAWRTARSVTRATRRTPASGVDGMAYLDRVSVEGVNPGGDLADSAARNGGSQRVSPCSTPCAPAGFGRRYLSFLPR